VAIEPATGRILALVSRPNFDPNIFAAGVRAEEWGRLVNDPAAPLWDRPVRSLYPPGSTFKAVTALAALSDSLVTEASYMRSPCRGWLRIGNRVFKCWAKGGHGSLNLHQAVVQSCDVYFYQLGMMLKVSGLSKWALDLGLGRKTGIDLPKEVAGLIPTEQWYDAKLGKGRITAGLSANMAIGQGEVLTTPLQMAMLYAAIGNRGMLARPHLVLKAEGFDGEVLSSERIESARLPASEAGLAAIVKALEGVVNEPGGTGGAARVEGVTVAGKTGTAQNPHGKDHSWFVGFAPSQEPAIAVAVVVENAGHGSAVAAPMVGKIIREYLSKVRTAPSAPLQLAGRP
jgi:penicillin-binding protein 2